MKTKGLWAVVIVALSLTACDVEYGKRSPVHEDPFAASEERSAVPQAEERDVRRGSAENRAPVLEREEESVLLTLLFSWGLYLVWYAIGVIVGILVFRDARRRPHLAMNIRPLWWCLICIFDAALGLLVYWVMNYSSLVPTSGGRERGPDFGP